MVRPERGRLYAFEIEGGYAVLLVVYDFTKFGSLVWVAQPTFSEMPTVRDAEMIVEWRWPQLVSLPPGAIPIGDMPVPPELASMPRMRVYIFNSGSPYWREQRYADESGTRPVVLAERVTVDASLQIGGRVANDHALRELIRSGYMPVEEWRKAGSLPVVPDPPSTPVFTAAQPGAGEPYRRSGRRGSRSTSAEPVLIVVRVNDRVQPVHRGERYEDPLDEVLARRARGSRVVGGGTEFGPEAGPLSCDLEIETTDDPEAVVALIVNTLSARGAPMGSWVRVGEGEQVSFGATRGYALELDGVGLPARVYAENDVEDLIGAVNADLAGAGELHSSWAGQERTSLYFYGDAPARIREVLTRAAGQYALAAGSRVVPLTDPSDALDAQAGDLL